MKGVVLGEFSATISSAFRAVGIDCWSCDLLPTEGDPAWHIQNDFVEVAYGGGWDFAVAHPVCTVLANSGRKHLFRDGNSRNGPHFTRWEDMELAAHTYRLLRDAPIEFKAVENPVMHGFAIEATRRGPTRFYHPHFFGDPFFKLTGFELVNLPWLVRTHYMDVPRPRTAEHMKWSKIHRMKATKIRGHERSRFEPGFARAIANQWGAFMRKGYDL